MKCVLVKKNDELLSPILKLLRGSFQFDLWNGINIINPYIGRHILVEKFFCMKKNTIRQKRNGSEDSNPTTESTSRKF